MQLYSSKRSLNIVLCFLLVFNTTIGFAIPAQKRANSARTSGKPRLVVGIVIDQFRYDYLTRFADLYKEGGFRRLMTDGAVFANANYLHAPTVTACGHATFMSGSSPSMNGIIGNDWFDRNTGRLVTSVSDPATKLLGGKEGAEGASPHRLIGTTLGDQLRLASGEKAKVVGIAMKDRSAILPVGKRPNGAYWFSASAGGFVSSTYYFNDLPEWVKRFNRESPASKYFGSQWTKLLPDAAYARSTPDDAPYEKSKFGRQFPHRITGGEAQVGAKFYEDFGQSPFANEYTLAFARAAIENEGLGQDEQPDLLTVSLSANDAVGHTFGPYSQEVQDITLRTDRALAEFFNYLDQRVGLRNTVIVLTADHGVAPVPEHAAQYGVGGRVVRETVTGALERALTQRFGEEKWIKSTANSNIYFDYEALNRRHANLPEVERIAAEAVQNIPGIAACFTREQILAGQLPPGPIGRSIAYGFNAQRNGDLVVVLQPYYVFGTGTATHGTPYSYDKHVPVILMGAGLTPGRYLEASSPADIAPTLAALLEIEPPSNYVGRVLVEALAPQKP